jgi:hypothetical protein
MCGGVDAVVRAGSRARQPDTQMIAGEPCPLHSHPARSPMTTNQTSPHFEPPRDFWRLRLVSGWSQILKAASAFFGAELDRRPSR